MKAGYFVWALAILIGVAGIAGMARSYRWWGWMYVRVAVEFGDSNQNDGPIFL
jgi:hypothetical protein